MNTSKKFYSELAYLVGMLVLAFGTALMEKANFGMSMVVAPAYILHLKLSQYISWFSFGMAEYCLQAFLILLLSIVLKQFKVKFIFSFFTAVFYGIILDFWIMLTSSLIPTIFITRLCFYLVGMLCCSFGVAMLFHTYIAPEAYELVVKEISDTFKFSISKTKTTYDCISLLCAIILSFAFFGIGHFEGVKLGTIICAFTNGFIIGKVSDYLDTHFTFINLLKK